MRKRPQESAQRDPRNLMELRRLALRAQPSQWSYGRPAERAVLHDALLETFPETYPKYIKKAERLAKIHKETYLVFFQPQYLKARWRERHRPGLFFDVDRWWNLPFRHSTDVIVHSAGRSAEWYKQGVR